MNYRIYFRFNLNIFLLILYSYLFYCCIPSSQPLDNSKESDNKRGGNVPPEYRYKLCPPQIYSQVLFVKYMDDMGSAIRVVYDSTSYIVTVKHFFNEPIKHGQIITIEYYSNKKWIKSSYQIFFHENRNIDMAVLKPLKEDRIKPDFDISGNFLIGDEGFMLGFPISLRTENDFYDGRPIPLIRKVIFSGSMLIDSIDYIIVDGISVPGFSGGPVFIKAYRTGDWAFAGIIKGGIQDNNNENSGFTAVIHSNYAKEIVNKIKQNIPRQFIYYSDTLLLY